MRRVACAIVLSMTSVLASVSACGGVAAAAPGSARGGPPAVRPAGHGLPGRQISQQRTSPATGSEVDTQMGPSIAVDPRDPRRLVAAVQAGRFATVGGSAGIDYAWSHDAGRSWHTAPLPGLTTSTGGIYDRVLDPVVTFAADGTVYASALEFNTRDCDNVISVQRSTDGGRTFGPPVIVQVETSCQVVMDRNWIVVDRSPSSRHRGRLYLFWVTFVFDQAFNGLSAQEFVRYSDDRGASWSPATEVSGFSEDTQAPQPVIRANGDVLDIYTRFTDFTETAAHLVARTSTDGGRTWGPEVSIADQVFPGLFGGTGPGMRDGGILASATIDPVTGRIYAVWADSRLRTGGARDVLLAQSPDGRRWSPPQRVDRGSLADGVDRFTPAVAAFGGRVAVTFRDRALAPAPAGLVGMRIAVSRDGGRSFGPAARLGPDSDLGFAARTGQPPGNAFLGDYMQVAAGPGVAYPVWAVSGPGAPGVPTHQTTWSATVHM
ncbi:MAG: hypothetical protein V7637_1014 [Mycobacteriales bacterium]|jgi:hypothetical protein